MRAVVFPSPEQLSIEQVDDPACGAEDVIVQVSQAGICGTDLHIFRNEYLSAFPLIAGHEFAGLVAEAGKEVTTFKRGDRVAVDPNLYCGECYFCRQEQANHCLNWQGVGITHPGGFAEYVAVPARACYQVPERLTDTQAAFIEPLSCVIHALKRLRVFPGDEVLIFGAGPMGLLLVQALRNSGASQIVVVEKEQDRRSLAIRLGATSAIAPDPDLAKVLHEQAPYGHAIVIDATGVPAVIQQALRFLKPRGQYLQFGVAPRGSTVQW
ncbi:MAG: zinc-dependent alcohol dehydrogenase family protein, partial [Anaerolineaceae bacterium]